MSRKSKNGPDGSDIGLENLIKSYYEDEIKRAPDSGQPNWNRFEQSLPGKRSWFPSLAFCLVLALLAVLVFPLEIGSPTLLSRQIAELDERYDWGESIENALYSFKKKYHGEIE